MPALPLQLSSGLTTMTTTTTTAMKNGVEKPTTALTEHEKNVRLRQNIQNSIRNIKIDGLPNIFRTKLIGFQIMWLVVLAFSSSFCVYLLANSFLEYFQFKVTTNYRLLSELKSIFPTVTLCNMNPMNTEYYMQLLAEANLTSVNATSAPYYTFLALEEWHKRTTGEYFTLEERLQMSNLEEMLISCTFQNIACNASSFTYLFHPKYLNCYQFNSGKDESGEEVHLQQATIDGTGNSLVFELYAGVPNEMAELTSQRGFYIFINNNTAYPFNFSPAPLSVTPGFGMTSNVVRSFYNQFNQWPYQYSDCTVSEEDELIKPLADTSLFELVKEAEFAYSRDTCILFCYQRLNAPRCNCTNYWISWRVPGYDYCMSEEQQKCADTFYEDVFNEGTYVNDMCIDKCPLECHKQSFDNFLSYYLYPEPAYVTQKLQNNEHLVKYFANETDFNKNLASSVVQFSIFYDSLSYTNVEEEPKITWDSLMGTLGGHLHIFLGMSLLSFIELIELVVNIMYAIVLERRLRKDGITKRADCVELGIKSGDKDTADAKSLTNGNGNSLTTNNNAASPVVDLVDMN